MVMLKVGLFSSPLVSLLKSDKKISGHVPLAKLSKTEQEARLLQRQSEASPESFRIISSHLTMASRLARSAISMLSYIIQVLLDIIESLY
jgi:hypothetical protein